MCIRGSGEKLPKHALNVTQGEVPLCICVCWLDGVGELLQFNSKILSKCPEDMI